MKILSLFDGISGFQQAFTSTFPNQQYTYYASEVDKYAIATTQHNFPNTIQLGDVRNVNNSIIKDQIDILCGGSPCQDLSIANNYRKGLEGERSKLFYEYVRILRELKPKYFILENVASMSNENRETMSQELFNIKPVLINSALVTAQSRKRLYFVGCLQDDGTYKTIDIPQPENKGIMLKDTLESSLSYTDKSYALTASYNGAVFWNTLEKKQRSMILEPICDKNDIKYIGCAIRGRHTGNSIQQKLEFRKDDKSNCITTVHKDSLVSERIGQIGNGGQGQRIYSINAKSVTLSANGGGQGGKIGMYKVDLPDGEYIVRKLMPIECERLQGYPDNYTIGSNTQRYKMLGNSFTVPVICHILQSLVS